MRLCASLFRGVAAPLGCAICLQLGDVAVFSLCAQYFLIVRGGGGITTLGLFHTFRKPCVARGQNGVLCRFWVLVGCTPEERREPRDSDALMRVAVPRRRGPAGLRSLLPVCIQLVLVGWKDLTRRSGRVTITRNNRTASRLALVQRLRWAVK